MIPGVSFEWEDLSFIPDMPVEDSNDGIDRPIAMCVFTSDKGPEEWMHKLRGKLFYNYYGTPDFKKHGQPFLQAARFADVSIGGGYVTCKRIVAPDATLANLSLIATVTKGLAAAQDASGRTIYHYNLNGKQMTYYGNNDPVPGVEIDSDATNIVKEMRDIVRIEYSFHSNELGNTNDVDYLAAHVRSNYDNGDNQTDENTKVYPLAVIADMGRGVSNKRFRIYSVDQGSTPSIYQPYIFEISENGTILEQLNFTFNPDIIEKRTGQYISTSLEDVCERYSAQVRVRFFDDIYDDFIAELEKILEGQVDNLAGKDVLFAKDQYGNKIYEIDTNAANLLDDVFGIPLVGGSNGSFGDYPALLEKDATIGNEVDREFAAAFSGNTFDGNDIYDLDNNRIDCIFDANYHPIVKRAIEQLVNFREDCMFFRDSGTNCKDIRTIRTIDGQGSKSRFIASYCNYYKIYDPYTRKKITVTVTYHLSTLFIRHFLNGRARPFCGQKYGIIIPNTDFVKGSINFTPAVLPDYDQRQIFDNLRINYLSYYDGDVLTMNSGYTSQTIYTELSWINNVLAVQEVIKAIRALCPRIRYSFLDGDDLIQYRQDVNQVITYYSNRFASAELEFANNKIYDANKYVYAVLRVTFRPFAQTEKFKIIALPSA